MIALWQKVDPYYICINNLSLSGAGLEVKLIMPLKAGLFRTFDTRMFIMFALAWLPRLFKRGSVW